MGSITDDSIYENLCNNLRAQGNVEIISKSFGDIRHDEGRVEYVYNLLAEWHLLPSSRKLPTNSKSTAESRTLRNEGNKMFQKKDDDQALILYTQSIAFANVPSQNDMSDTLALAFANRSAVLHSMGKFRESLKDIEEALKYNYPQKLHYKLFERKGKCHLNLGNLQEAQCSFMEAINHLSKADGLSEEKRNLLKGEFENQYHHCHTIKATSNGPESGGKLHPKIFQKHPQIPCASNALKVTYSNEMGRYIEAAEDIQPGDVLLVEKPYASILLPECYLSHCALCLKHSYALLPCSTCSMVMYCSEECRSQSWQLSHRIECPLLPALLQLDSGKFVLLAIKILLVASSCGEELSSFLQQLSVLKEEELASGDKKLLGLDVEGMYRSDSYGPIYHLVGNTETRSVGDLFRRAVTAVCALDCLRKLTSFFPPEVQHTGCSDVMVEVGGVLLRHLQNLPCNAHEVSEYVHTTSERGHKIAESVEIGAAAYATLSLLNHACDPNVVRHSVAGDSVVLRALRPIQRGEQVLDNYGQHYALHPRQQRQTHMSSQYHFQCACMPCQDDWPCYDQLPTTGARYLCEGCRQRLPAGDETTALTCTHCGRTTNVLDLQKKLLVSSKKFVELLSLLLEGEEITDPQPLIAHLKLLDACVERPWKEYSDCQETLKQCFNITGNYYRR